MSPVDVEVSPPSGSIAPMSALASLRLVVDASRARRGGHAAIARRQSTRLTDLIGYARAQSPFYRELYRNLPEDVDQLNALPVVTKAELRARFDDWATNREVTLDRAGAFAATPERAGERFLDKYVLATTSGTTGTPGIFILDERSLAVARTMALRMLLDWIGLRGLLRLVLRGARISLTVAPGHAATQVAAAGMRKSAFGRKRLLTLPVHMPLREMVERLNEFDPTLLAPYATVAALLASEQETGKLQIRPTLVALAAEGLPIPEYDRISRTFRAHVGNSYAATECPFLSYGCTERWLHVNADWAILEPVDAEYRPTPPGEQSHTVLLTNLANRVQPILRYDLGDSVVLRPDPCPCGNPLPALRVQGRAADVATFATTSGESVSVPPLAFEFDDIPGLQFAQFEQTAPNSLRVRLQCVPDAESDDVWPAVQAALRGLLAGYGLEHVSIERDPQPPQQSQGGKFRTVIPLR